MTADDEQPVRVVCVDDNPLIVETLAVRLAMEPWVTVVDVLNRADGLAEAAAAAEADVVLLDVDMPGKDAFEALAELVLRRPESRCIILSGHVRTDLLDRAAAGGAWGYVSKTAGSEAILTAIRGVRDGRFVVSADLHRST
jgi:two-component system response regulator DesR